MRNVYGAKTHVHCRGCGRKIFFNEAEANETGSQLTIECTHTCPLHGLEVWYDEAEVTIY